MDRVNVQVRFRRGIFTCKCGQEDIVDWSMSGGNTYENNCSKCGAWSNSFTNYSGCISYTPEEYEALKAEDIVQAKDDLVADFIYQQKNPPPYVEPTAEEVQKMIDEKQAEIDTLTVQKSEIEAKTIEDIK